MPKHVSPWTVPGAGWVALLACLGAAPTALAVPGGGNSAATITGSFADSCRDFAANSSKDISFVELHYAGGSVVKDESISSPDHAIDGGPGDEIDFVIVKSGTTAEEFDCVPSNTAPTAWLEIKTPPVDQVLGHCYDFFTGGGGGLVCEASSPWTVWTSASEIPDNGAGQILLIWGCGGFSDPSQCSTTMIFRGTGSTDADGDIASWSLDFGDGTSTSGSWSTAPPTEVAHQYPHDVSDGTISCSGVCVITLTVTDSAGQSDSDLMVMVGLGQAPD